MIRRIFISAIVFMFGGMSLPTGRCPAQPLLPKMRISIENSDTHVQTQAIKKFAENLKQKLKDDIDVQFFSNATLFRDRDVIQALGQGKVEMAVPGTWHFTRFEPNVGIFSAAGLLRPPGPGHLPSP